MTDALADATAGAFGTGISKLVCYPLDIAKTRLSAGAEQGTLSVLREIVAKEGVAGLYRGIDNKLLKSCSQKFIYFYIFKMTNVNNNIVE